MTCHENPQQRLACSSPNWGSTNNSVAVCTDNISTVGLNSHLKHAEEDIWLCIAGCGLKSKYWKPTECAAIHSRCAHLCRAENKAFIKHCGRCSQHLFSFWAYRSSWNKPKLWFSKRMKAFALEHQPSVTTENNASWQMRSVSPSSSDTRKHSPQPQLPFWLSAA